MAKDTLPSPLDSALASMPSFGIPADLHGSANSSASYKLDDNSPVPYTSEFMSSSRKYGVPVNVLAALGEQESRFNPTALGQATQYGRAKGIMQYIDSTAGRLGINPYDPAQSIDAAARQLRQRLDNGYSMQEAIAAHFGGDDRKQWGPKTHAYGSEVLERAARLLKNKSWGPQDGEAAQPAASQDPYPAAASGMENMNQDYLRYRHDAQAAADALNQQNGGNLQPMTEQQFLQEREKQALGVNAADPAATNAQDSTWQATVKSVQNIPDRMKRGVAGVMRGFGEGVDDASLVVNASQSGVLQKLKEDGVITTKQDQPGEEFMPDGKPATTEAIASYLRQNAGKYYPDQNAASVAGLEPNAVVRKGTQIADKATANLDKNAVHTDSTLTNVVSGAIGTIAEMVPGIVASTVTKNAAPAMAQMSVTSYGNAYEDARRKGLQPDQARSFASLSSLADTMPSSAPIAAIVKPGQSLIKRALVGTLGEGAANGFSEAIHTLLENGYLNAEMTTGQAIERIRDGFLIGAVAGPGFAGVTHLTEAAVNKLSRRNPEAGTGDAAPAPEDSPAPEENAPVPEQNAPAPGENAPLPEQNAPEKQDPVPAAAPPAPTGPLGAALQSAPTDSRDAQHGQVIPGAADNFLGAPGSITSVTPRDNPQEPFNATVLSYHNGEALIRDENGMVMQLSVNDVLLPQAETNVDNGLPASNVDGNSEADDANVAIQQALQAMHDNAEASPAPEPAAAPEKSASNEGEKSEVPPAEAAPVQKQLSEMDEPELRQRLKFLGTQAKNSGWSEPLMRERRKVEAAIKALKAQADTTPEAPAVPQPETTAAATPAEEKAAPAKWFGSQEKADKYLTKNNLQDSHTVVQSGRRFEVQPKEQAAPAQDNALQSDAGQTPKPAQATKSKSPHIARARKMVGEINDVVTPSEDIGYAKAGENYKVAHIEKNGTVHLENTSTGSATSVNRAEIERARSRQATWTKVEAQAENAPQTASLTAPVVEAKTGEWQQFGEASGTLNVPRAEMPQISAEHRGAMVNFLNARGVKHQEETVPAASLKPTQAEYSSKKVAKSAAREGGDRSILISSDNHVLDGHHQWLAARDKGDEVKTIRLDAPIKELLPLAHEFPSSTIDETSAPKAAVATAEETAVRPDTVGDVYSPIVNIGRTARAGHSYEMLEKGPSGHVRLRDIESGAEMNVTAGELKQNEGNWRVSEAKPTKTEPETAKSPQKEALAATKPGKSAYGADNKLVSQDRAEELRRRLKAKFSQLNSGIDPEILAIGTELAVFHLEAGVRKFKDFARTMAKDLDQPLAKVRPYLRSWYNGARDMMEDSGVSIDGMDSPEAVRAEMATLKEDAPAPAEPKPAREPAAKRQWSGKNADVANIRFPEYNRNDRSLFMKQARSYLEQVAAATDESYIPGKFSFEAGEGEVGPDVRLKMNGPESTDILLRAYVPHDSTNLPATASGVVLGAQIRTPLRTGDKAEKITYLNVDDNASEVAHHLDLLVHGELGRHVDNRVRATGALDDMVSQFDNEVKDSGKSESVGEPGETALERAPADPVQGTDGERPAGGRAAAGGRTNARGNERARSKRPDDSRSVGNDPREVPVSTGRGDSAGADGKRIPDDGAATPDQSASAGRRVAPAAGTTAPERPAAHFNIDASTIGKGGDKTKYRNNVAAIRILKQLESSNRQATAEEQAQLAKYVGWGGLPSAFERQNKSASKGWEKEVAELRDLLSPEEYAAAAASTRNAHYTAPEIVEGIYAALQRLGFSGGRVLEPSVGVGNFFGLMPAGIRSASSLHGVELDRITSGIAQHLYPEAKIARMGFQEYTFPDGYFDAVTGNPPFGSEKLYDGKRKDLSKFSIHNYFFARAIDGLRPGGVLAQVVTNRFMDGRADAARQYIADRADLIGAIRLPNNAFMKNAGTEVTTDIIFLKKRAPGEAAAGHSWLNVAEHTDKNGATVPLNEYFSANPDMMLGDFGAYGSMYRDGEPALVARDGQNTPAELQRAIAQLPAGIMKPAFEVKPETRETVQAENVRVGSMYLDGNGNIMQRGEDSFGERQATQLELPSKRAVERVQGMLRVRDALTRLRQLQLSDSATDKALGEARERMNNAYDKFVAAHGPINLDANKRLFRDDPTWPQISALEEDFDRGVSRDVGKKTGEEPRKPSARKAAIFTKRTQQPYRETTSAGTAKDALVASLADRGRVDMDHMAQLYGKTPEQVASELGDLVFNTPDGWQTREEYLSGNVKTKLAQAKRAAADNPEMARNVEALQAVQPKDVEAVDINVKPGAAWVPPETMSDFARFLSEDANARAFYNNLTARWTFTGLKPSAAANTRFGTSRMNMQNVLEATAAQRALQVYDEDVKGSRTLNETETQLANEKAKLIRQEWDRWLWQDDARREKLSRIYNDQFNTDVQRDFDGSHLSFPGKISDDIIKLRPHQGNAVWRIVQSQTTLTDHVVGAGKTFTLIAAAMEMRRLGHAKKPMFVVPNHLVGQWAKDFLTLYPGANVLATTKADFEKGKRKRLFARITTGDWDAVIVAHSSFGKVQMDPHLETQFIQEEINEITSSIAQIEEAEGKRTRNVKQAADRRTRLEEKLKKLIDVERKDDSLYWSELGIDGLFLDEAHEFKNLGYSTGMRGVAGLGNPTGSQKAMDLYMKVRHLRSTTGGKNVVFATGTPISNTMAEMYTNQRYLDYDNLKAQGLLHFDAWARNFGEVVTDWELSPSGQYKMNSRFAKFVNMPELMQRYTSFADVINRDDINRMLALQGKKLPVPKVKGGKPDNVVVARSQDQADFIGEPIDGGEEYPRGSLVWRAENLPKKPEKGADNMLKIMSDARKAALDMRLIDPSYPDNPNSKVNESASRIKSLYDQWHDDKGTQLVFIDLSTPKASKGEESARLRQLMEDADSSDQAVADAAQQQLDKISPDEFLALQSDFSVYDDLKAKLVARGIPVEEVAFIHDAKTDLQKEQLFNKVRKGEIRVLFGSTAKMGAGMNVQDRLVGLHHLDAPWRPSDLEQREGRIIRQGNKLYDRNPENFEVSINRYATKQTLDSRMWQTIESKANFIEQVRKGNTGLREVEDIGGEAANAAEMKAASSGNPLILEEMTLRQRIRALENERNGHDREQFRVRDQINFQKAQTRTADRTLEKLQRDVKLQQPEPFALTIGGETFDKRKDAGNALKDAAAVMAENGVTSRDLGQYGEFSLHLDRAGFFNEFILTLKGAGEYQTKLTSTDDPAGLTQRMMNSVRDLLGAIEKMEDAKAASVKAVPQLEKQLKPWGKEDQLKQATARHGEVIEQLRPKKKEAAPAADKESVPAADPEQAGPHYGDLTKTERSTSDYGFAAEAMAELAAHDEMFQYPRATGKRSLASVFEAVMPTTKIKWEQPQRDDNQHDTGVTHVRGETIQGRDINIYETPSEVWFDVSNVNEGEGGAGIYQAVAEYALNTGRKFVGDPDGLSDIALRRRTEAMLSSALKHGTTRHLEPHDRQILGDKALGVPPMKWREGDDFYNMRSMIETSLGNIHSAVPEIKRATYDFGTGSFRNSAGEPLLAETLRSWLQHPKLRAARAGRSTVKRSILLNALARTESGAQSGLLERLFGVGSQLLSPELALTFYDRPLSKGVEREATQRLQRLQKLAQADSPNFTEELHKAADWLNRRAQAAPKRTTAAAHIAIDRAEVSGSITKEAADLAHWALDRAPHMANDLDLIFEDTGGSYYNPAAQIAHLMTSNMRDTSILHEILHHTERMLPEDVQAGINKAYDSAFRTAYDSATPEVRHLLDDLRLMPYPTSDQMARRHRVLEAFHDGKLDYDQHYQLTNASEWWAVNATSIMGDRSAAAAGGWKAKARQWYSEFMQKMRGLFGKPNHKAIIDGLAAVEKSDGSFQSKTMLGGRPDAFKPEVTTGDYADMPHFDSGMKPDPKIPTPEAESGQIRSWWNSFKETASDTTTNAMKKGLSALPLRPLVIELGRHMNGAKEYMRLKQSMDAMRSKWHEKTDTVAREWQSWASRNKDDNAALMEIMHESTLEQVDPSQPFGALMTDRDRDALAIAASNSKEEASLLKKAAQDRKRRDAHKSLEQRYNALPEEAKALYQRVRDTYSELADGYESVLLKNMEKAIDVRIRKAERDHKKELRRINDEALKGTERQEAVEAADRALKLAKTKIAWNRKARITQLRIQFEMERLGGPYFPLARFGNLFVTVRNKRDGSVKSFSRFEGARAQRKFAEEMRQDKNHLVEVGALSDASAVRKAIDPNFVADVEDILADLPNAEQVKDEVWQRYLESLPDISVRKNRIHRSGRDGFNTDALRAFGSQMFHGSHQLARLAHSFEMEEALEQAREEARDTSDPTRSGLVVNELEKRHQFIMNPTGGPVATAITQAAFVYALAASPKAAVMNLFQTAIMGTPMLAAFHAGKNGMGVAAKELTRASIDFTRGRGWTARSGSLTPKEKEAMEAGYSTGVIDRSQSHDLAGLAESGVSYSPKREKVMRAIAWGFHHSERFNREVTYLAAYRMARDKGLGHNAAVLKAGDLTWKTHFDYQNTSRPRIMHSDMMKAALVFRNFQVNMLYRLFRDVHQWASGESKEVRREAFVQLAGTTGMMMLSAGVTGTWLFGVAMMMAGLFMDDDQDPQAELKKGMVETMGPMMAGIVLDGVPGYVTGTSLSGSVGMPDLWFRSPDRQLEGKEEFQYWQSQLLGAAPSMLQNVMQGWKVLKQGQVYRGIETMMPKAIKDPMRAYRYATEGATNLRGDKVTDVSVADVIKQGLGFTPARVSEQYALNNENYNKQQTILTRRSQLVDHYYKADEAGDDKKLDQLDKDIDAFNDKYPEMEITGKTLNRSAKTRDNNAEDATGGMRYNKSLRDRLLDEQTPTVYR